MRTDRNLPAEGSRFLRGPVGESVRDALKMYLEPFVLLRQRVVARYRAAKAASYAAIFLDDSSHRTLLRWWEQETGIPLHSDVKAHHVTLAFRPTEEEAARIPVGIHTPVRVVGWAADVKGQAVLVRTEVPSTNPYPHITIAVAPGVNAVYSNELLAKNRNHVLGPRLSGIVDIRKD